VAFPPPPVTSPATRLIVLRHERRSTRLADHFQGALLVFIRVTFEDVLRHFQQAFRLRFRTFETMAFRSCCLRTHASPRMFHLPVPVKMPVSNLDYVWSLHHKFSMSSRKYFRFRPYFIGLLWKSCGKTCGKIVDIFVENPATFLQSKIKNFVTFLDFGNLL